MLGSAAIGPWAILSLLVAAAALFLVTGRIHPWEVQACITMEGPPPPQPPPPTPDWWRWAIPATCVVALAVGHATSHVRSRLEEVRSSDPASALRGSRIVQSTVVAFLAVGVGLSIYEALSVVPDVAPPTFWPISYYVRCANDVAPYPTLLGAAIMAFVLGHWFCHPGDASRRRAA